VSRDVVEFILPVTVIVVGLSVHVVLSEALIERAMALVVRVPIVGVRIVHHVMLVLEGGLVDNFGDATQLRNLVKTMVHVVVVLMIVVIVDLGVFRRLLLSLLLRVTRRFLITGLLGVSGLDIP